MPPCAVPLLCMLFSCAVDRRAAYDTSAARPTSPGGASTSTRTGAQRPTVGGRNHNPWLYMSPTADYAVTPDPAEPSENTKANHVRVVGVCWTLVAEPQHTDLPS